MKKTKNLKKSTSNIEKAPEKKDKDLTNMEKEIYKEFGIGLIRETVMSPFLPPKILKEYEEIKPGLAEVLIDNALQNINHQKEEEKKYLEMENKKTLRGQIFGLIVVLTSIGAAIACVFKGAHTVAAILAAGSTGTQIITQFVGSRKTEKKDKESEDKGNND